MASNKSLLFVFVAVAILTYYSFIFYKITQKEISYERNLKNRLLNDQESSFNDYLWGSYRGNLYFGMRTRTPQALLTGLMWFGIDSFQGDQCKLLENFYYHLVEAIRHSCEISDNLGQWGWEEHDGKTFGKQVITDLSNNCKLKIVFTKTAGCNGGSWNSTISGSPIDSDLPMRISLIHYVGYNFENSHLKVQIESDQVFRALFKIYFQFHRFESQAGCLKLEILPFFSQKIPIRGFLGVILIHHFCGMPKVCFNIIN